MLSKKKGVFSTKFTQKWSIHVDFSPKPILEPQSKQAKANKRRGLKVAQDEEKRYKEISQFQCRQLQ